MKGASWLRFFRHLILQHAHAVCVSIVYFCTHEHTKAFRIEGQDLLGNVFVLSIALVWSGMAAFILQEGTIHNATHRLEMEDTGFLYSLLGR